MIGLGDKDAHLELDGDTLVISGPLPLVAGGRVRQRLPCTQRRADDLCQ